MLLSMFITSFVFFSNTELINAEVINPFINNRRVDDEVLLKLCAGANWEHDGGTSTDYQHRLFFLIFFAAAIHSTNAEKLFCLMQWEKEPNLLKEKKARMAIYLDRFMESSEEGVKLNPKEMSISVLERYLLVIDWLNNSPETIELIRQNYNILGEHCAFRVNTFYTGAFKDLPHHLKPVVTAMFFESNPKWPVKEFKKKCTAIPRRGEAQALLEKAVSEAIAAKVDEAAVNAVCSFNRDVAGLY